LAGIYNEKSGRSQIDEEVMGASVKHKNEENAAVFGQIVREHKRAVFAVAYAKLRNVHDAEDITQDVFVEVYRNFRKLRNPEKIRPWLHKVTLCRCNDNLRKRIRRQKREHMFAGSIPHKHFADSQIEEERRGAVLEAIGLLSEKHRVVVMLKYYARLSYADISKTTGLSKSTISNHLQAAKKRLREHLSKTGEGADIKWNRANIELHR
jgi:RNA polymerase sigma factor (sigma-70 family)